MKVCKSIELCLNIQKVLLKKRFGILLAVRAIINSSVFKLDGGGGGGVTGMARTKH